MIYLIRQNEGLGIFFLTHVLTEPFSTAVAGHSIEDPVYRGLALVRVGLYEDTRKKFAQSLGKQVENRKDEVALVVKRCKNNSSEIKNKLSKSGEYDKQTQGMGN